MQAERTLEQLKDKFERLGTHEENKRRAEITSAAVCMSLSLDQPQKRTRTTTTGRGGREEAVVLTSDQQVATSEARQRLRLQRGDMHKEITSAKQAYRTTKSTSNKKLECVEKRSDTLEKALEKAVGHATMAHTWADAAYAERKQLVVLLLLRGQPMPLMRFWQLSSGLLPDMQ